jgi:A/G-specific adenine glycosylase
MSADLLIPDPAAFRARLGRWFIQNGRDLPWRRTTDPYAILVSEMMLQQTQVATVLPYFARWMERFPDLESLAKASEEAVLSQWQGLGYYARARNLHRAAQAVCERHSGRFPDTIDALRALPGIGPYTAGALAAFAFDRPEPLVDANIARLIARLIDLREPIDSTAGSRALWETSRRLQPRGRAGGRRFNSALMELGALVCRPARPDCERCPVRVHCAATEPESLPVKRPRVRTRDRLDDRVWIVAGDGSFLLGREPGNRWRGLWVLPRAVRPPAGGVPLVILKHHVMHERITLRVWPARSREARSEERRIAAAEFASIPMPAPHRRAIRRLLSA